MDAHPTNCICHPCVEDCIKELEAFNAWCDAEDAKQEARRHNDCGPLCAEHGSPLDTSIDVVRLGLAPR